jgi:hypothetical protein
MVQRLALRSSYLKVIHGLFEMYRLAVEGKFESPEGDAIRDAMDESWEQLTETEREGAADLSAGLNAVMDGSTNS